MSLNNFNAGRCSRCGRWFCQCCNPCRPPRPPCPPGPTGPAGVTASTIPFSISSASGSGIEIATDIQGNPEIINFAGFGPPGYSPIFLQPGEWNSGIITIRENHYYPTSFILPYNAILDNIYVIFANRSPLLFEIGVTMLPFACIAISTTNNLAFTILQNTMTFTEPYIGTGDVNPIPKYSLRRGALTNLNISLAAGTLVGIVVGWIGQNVISEEFGQFSISGGILLK